MHDGTEGSDGPCFHLEKMQEWNITMFWKTIIWGEKELNEFLMYIGVKQGLILIYGKF